MESSFCRQQPAGEVAAMLSNKIYQANSWIGGEPTASWLTNLIITRSKKESQLLILQPSSRHYIQRINKAFIIIMTFVSFSLKRLA